MRGKLFRQLNLLFNLGITPADAGKTLHRYRRIFRFWDHPRGCGENIPQLIQAGITLGSPPRMRGKLRGTAFCHETRGITPADAGKTASFPCQRVIIQDHPRGCGENLPFESVVWKEKGSPPRMRGKPLYGGSVSSKSRITPADAGKTRRCCAHRPKSQDHPRGCGENYEQLVGGVETLGSPPRMRGKPTKQRQFLLAPWITPADAGKTPAGRSGCRRAGDHPRGCGENQHPRRD